MKLVVGLGNPGSKYVNTRHNVGFMVVDELAKLNLPDVVLFKPQKFMNKSGVEVKNLQVPNLQDLYIIHDDLDIELGKFKISFGRGPKVHNGLKSIYQALGSKNFWHVRVGIDNRAVTQCHSDTGEKYVLSSFRPEEKTAIDEVIEKVVAELNHVLT